MNTTKKVRSLRLNQDVFEMLCTLQPGRNISKIQRKYVELQKKLEGIEENWFKVYGEDFYIYKNGEEKILVPDAKRMKAVYLSFFHVDSYREILNRVNNISSGLLEKYERLADSSLAEIPSDFDRTMYYGLSAGPLSFEKASQMFAAGCPMLDKNGFIRTADDQLVEAVIVQDSKQSLYNVRVGAGMNCTEVERALKISVHVFDSGESLFDLAMNYGLFPDSLNWRDIQALKTFHSINMDGVDIKNADALEMYLADKNIKEMFGIKLTTESVRQEMMEDEIDLPEEDGPGAALRQYLDECDYHRARIQRYSSNWYLDDEAKGHWELWGEPAPQQEGIASDDSRKEYWVRLKQDAIARNPLSDVRMDAVVGIDFGTRSTIVALQDGDEDIWPMRVGMADYLAPPAPGHYENPTVIQFVDLASFLERYSERKGRPYTSWEDVKISHEAYQNMVDIKESWQLASFIPNLKQWAGGKSRKKGGQTALRDGMGFRYELKDYMEMKEGDLDPVEVYAYYLGLFINNMHMGIYLDYLLSFPGTFSEDVKSRILESFRRGIKHSLPECIFEDEKCRTAFRVRQGPSEPAAYAACALEQYGIEPTDDGILYGAFDFGGGTTDFDFGVWKNAPEDEYSYNYVLRHFTSGGDRNLGGEFLLELAAYYVFSDDSTKEPKKTEAEAAKPVEIVEEEQPKKGKGLWGSLFASGQTKSSSTATRRRMEPEKQEGGRPSNLQLMRDQKLVYFRPEEGRRFPGTETLVSSQELALLNTRQLMEVLRPIWEGDEVLEEWKRAAPGQKGEISIPCDGDGSLCLHADSTATACVRLFDAKRSGRKEMELYVDLELVDRILEERIEKGVQAFFNNMDAVFQEKGLTSNQPIHIFLGGNASRSDKVASIFRKYIGSSQKRFLLFPPLGTSGAESIRRKKGLVSEDNLMAPTGKTGVAFGLVMCREGSMIRVESELKKIEQSKISYYIGVNYRKNFKTIFDRTTECGKWLKFINASADMTTFEFYFTDLPEADTSMIPIKGNGSIFKHKCLVDRSADGAGIYFRFLTPSQLEYAVSTEEGIEKGELISSIYKVSL